MGEAEEIEGEVLLKFSMSAFVLGNAGQPVVDNWAGCGWLAVYYLIPTQTGRAGCIPAGDNLQELPCHVTEFVSINLAF